MSDRREEGKLVSWFFDLLLHRSASHTPVKLTSNIPGKLVGKPFSKPITRGGSFLPFIVRVSCCRLCGKVWNSVENDSCAFSILLAKSASAIGSQKSWLGGQLLQAFLAVRRAPWIAGTNGSASW